MEETMGRQTFEGKSHQQAESSPIEGLEQLLMPQTDNSRIVFLHGEVSENTIAQVIAQMLHLANVSPKPIYLVLSTYGGSIDEMFSLYDTIKFLPCPVHTVALGKVMSAGVLLLASGVKGKRLIGASARVMIHPVRGGTFGNVFEMENETKEATRLQRLMVSHLVSETRMTRKQIENVMNPMLDYFIMPDEAVKYGIVDKVIGAKSKV
jgi:ATP-dependent Clp protease protease subunit